MRPTATTRTASRHRVTLSSNQAAPISLRRGQRAHPPADSEIILCELGGLIPREAVPPQRGSAPGISRSRHFYGEPHSVGQFLADPSDELAPLGSTRRTMTGPAFDAHACSCRFRAAACLLRLEGETSTPPSDVPACPLCAMSMHSLSGTTGRAIPTRHWGQRRGYPRAKQVPTVTGQRESRPSRYAVPLRGSLDTHRLSWAPLTR